MLTLGSKVTKFELPREQSVAPYFRLSWITGCYEREIIALYSQILRPGMRVIDIGAHVGYHTIRFAKLVGSEGKVFAFEPCPSTFEVLCRNVRRQTLANVVLEQKAVSDASGQVDLFVGRHNLRHSTVPVGNIWVKVDSVSLDDYLRGEVIHLVKIDVEGAELKVLRGMGSLMDTVPDITLILEFYPDLLRASEGEDGPVELLNLLRDSGFYLYEIQERQLVALESFGSLEKFVSSVHKLTNLFACKSPWQ